jgi:hypothetical protein
MLSLAVAQNNVRSVISYFIMTHRWCSPASKPLLDSRLSVDGQSVLVDMMKKIVKSWLATFFDTP